MKGSFLDNNRFPILLGVPETDTSLKCLEFLFFITCRRFVDYNDFFLGDLMNRDTVILYNVDIISSVFMNLT